jgi:hypothetical protein
MLRGAGKAPERENHMTHESTAATPIQSPASATCLILLDQSQRSYRIDTAYGPSWQNDMAWDGWLFADLKGPEDDADPLAFEVGDSTSTRERDAMIKALKARARALGYKRCEVRDTTRHDGVIFSGALRKAKGLAG